MARIVLGALALVVWPSQCMARLSGPAPGPAAPAPGPALLPPATNVITNFNKQIRPLPDQGFDERSHPKWVRHNDFDTQLGDWQGERPRRRGEVHEGDSTTRACEEHPEYLWCNLWLNDRARKNKGTRVVRQVHEVTKAAGGERVVERVVRRQREAAQDAAKLKGFEKGVQGTGDQAGSVTDEMSHVLPPGMWPSRDDMDAQEAEKDKMSKEHGGDYPPGMVSKRGGDSPYEPVALHAQKVPAGGSLTGMW